MTLKPSKSDPINVKYLIFSRNCETGPATGGTLFHDTLELHQFAKHAAQLQHFLKRIILTFGSSLLAKFWLLL